MTVSNLAHLLFFADAGSVHTRRWVGAMVERGWRCTVASRQAHEIPGAEVIALNTPDGRLPWFAAVPRVRALVRSLAPDLVHGHYVTSYGFWAACAAQGRPLVLSAWGSDILVTPRRSRLAHALTGWTLRRADLITADSQDMLDAIGAWRPRAPVRQILWGADTDKFRPQPRAVRPLRIVSLRNWEPLYQIDVLLRALALLDERAPGLAPELHLLGGGPDEAALRALGEGLGLSPRLHWHGRVPEDRLAEVVRQAHLSVSVPLSDATSVSVLESMAAGLAMVVSDLPANRQWIDDRGGRIVPVANAPALAQALQSLLGDPQALESMGRHNRQRVHPEAARATQMDRMDHLYRGLLR
ncbi:MAG: glycosyltransferase [Burkholderiales bacterium]|nr:glycosyltransferase [Burkholderiales bacterium]